MNSLTQWVINNRLIVGLLLLITLVAGAINYRRLPTDAFPDISPVMVPIFAEAHGMAPEEVERLITFPLESEMNGLPGVRLVKSTSAFGMAVIYVYFHDDTDIYFARQIVSERMKRAMAKLPDMHEPPALGPISTGLGEAFMYYLSLEPGADTEGKQANTYLREVNDWTVKYRLQTVPGVTDILSMGGYVLQYQVQLDPHLLSKYELGAADVVAAINANNGNVGGQFLVLGSEEYLVRGVGLIKSLSDLGRIQLKVIEGVPIRLTDVARVEYGNQVRRGVVTLDGEHEIVAGIVLKLYGENSSQVIARLREKLPEIQSILPKGVKLVPYYDQGVLVERAVSTVRNALLQGGSLVLLVLFLFLGNIRAATIVALALPFCALFAFMLMGWTGMSANLMSLGGIAIAIGMLGDGAIVVVENIHRRLSVTRPGHLNLCKTIITSCGEVSRPVFFSTLIIIIVFLPLFTLEGVEQKMFSPMASTITFALLGSIIAALIMAPMLATFLLRPGQQERKSLLARLTLLYQPLLRRALLARKRLLAMVLILFVGSLLFFSRLGTEFIPVLEEGALQINVTMAPSISLEKAKEVIMDLQRRIGKHQQVANSVAKVGRPELGSHPHPVNFANIQIALKPDAQRQKQILVKSLEAELSAYPGIQLNFTQPIQNLFDELLSGVRTQLAIKLYGEDLEVLRVKAEEIRMTIDNIDGLVDLAVEQSYGQPQVRVVVDRSACARYGINASDVLEVVELAVGGEVIDQIYQNTRRYGIQVRCQERYRSSPEAIKRLLVHGEDGRTVPVFQVAKVEEMVGPIQVNRENNQRRWTISANVRGRDIGGVVSDIQKRVAEKIDLPSGYYLEYGGQFENQQRAMKRLAVIVPVTLALIFLMLYISLGRMGYALLIFLNVPLALIGGVIGLSLAGEYLSVPASVGFIALFGIAVQNGLVLVACINQLVKEGLSVSEAAIKGGLMRLRPVLMTALTTICGLMPLLLSSGAGSEVQRPLAVVVVCGLLSSTFLTLFVIPAFYGWFVPKGNLCE